MSQQEKPQVLLVPGSFSGGWVYERHFAPALREMGWHATCHTFRSHTTNNLARHRYGIQDFVTELEHAIEATHTKPWIIALSLGGRIVAEYLAKHGKDAKVAGAILLSPAPPTGTWRVAYDMITQEPTKLRDFALVSLFPSLRPKMNVQGKTSPFGIYTDDIDPEDLAYCRSHFRGESARVLAEILAPSFRSLNRISVPVKLIGTEGDKLIPPASVQASAKALNAPCAILPGSSHAMVVDTGWQDVLDECLDFIGEQDRNVVAA